MNMAEKVFEAVRSLPEFELREVLDFVDFLKARHGLAASQPANDALPFDDAETPETHWVELEKAARDSMAEPTKALDLALMSEVRSKVRTGVTWTRDELYDRDLR